MDDSSCQRLISKADPAILNYYRQFLIKGFEWRYFEILWNSDYRQLDFSQYLIITFKADKTFDYEGLDKSIYEAVSSYGINIIRSIIKINECNPGKRVFSGVSAILGFEVINFREYDCSNEPGSPNCQIVELFLTVDTSRKIQNGVTIDISIDRFEFCDFHDEFK